MRTKFIDAAMEYYGANEADGSHRVIIDLYNKIKPLPIGYRMSYTDDWCAAYISAVAQRLGITDRVFPECGCGRMIALYQAAGRWQEADDYTPQPGDLIFYDWQDGGKGDNRGEPDHVGIVVSVSGLSIKVIEGNVADRVGYRNLIVDAKNIRGYALPDFEGEGAVSRPETPAASVSTVGIRVPVLRRGMQGTVVRSMQLLLIGAGVDVGPDGADGDYGYNTAAAVTEYQKKKGLEADGIVGTDTWTALVNQ